MSEERGRVLAINPGTTSTKFGVFTRAGEEISRSIHHGDAEMARFKGRPVLERLEYRAGLIEASLAEAGFSAKGKEATLSSAGSTPKEQGAEPWAAVVGRGGLLPPMECGTYRVNAAMVEALRLARRGEHACNLGALLAQRFARAAGVEAYIVDPVTVDEWQPQSRLSGSPLVEREAIGHVLNSKAVAKRHARDRGQRYEELRLIVIHLGSGTTVSAHRAGRMIDQNTIYEGPFGPDRTGALPVRGLVQLCCGGSMTQAELERHVFGDGGIFAYLGTRDLMEVERRIEAGDRRASEVFEAMIYQVGKEAGAMAAVLEGKVDAVVVTGGMARSERVLSRLGEYVGWIGPVAVYPGEDELQALAEGVFRVLDGEERAKEMGAVKK